MSHLFCVLRLVTFGPEEHAVNDHQPPKQSSHNTPQQAASEALFMDQDDYEGDPLNANSTQNSLMRCAVEMHLRSFVLSEK